MDESDDVTSSVLGHVLNDISEFHSKVKDDTDDQPKGAIKTKSFEYILSNLRSLSDSQHTYRLRVQDEEHVIPAIDNDHLEKYVLRDANRSDLPSISSKSVTNFFDDALDSDAIPEDLTSVSSTSSTAMGSAYQEILNDVTSCVYRAEHGIEKCCELDSPSCVLSGLLVASKIRREENLDKFENLLNLYDQSE